MNAATRTTSGVPRHGMWIAMVIVLALVLGTALIGRIEPMTPALALLSAALCAAGTLLVAALMARGRAYPRWAWWGAAGAVSVALFLSVALAPSPAVWDAEMRPGAWLLPWMLAIFGTTRESRACATSAKRGWVLVAATIVLSTVMLGASAIVDGVRAMLG